jgi:hypothetical protein
MGKDPVAFVPHMTVGATFSELHGGGRVHGSPHPEAPVVTPKKEAPLTAEGDCRR